MLQRALFSVLVAFVLILGQNVHALAGDAGDETVDQMFEHQKKKSEDGDAGQNQDKGKENRSDGSAPSALGQTNLYLTFFKLIFALLLVLALIYLLYRFVRKRTKTFQEGRTIENLGGVSVGANRSVQLIRIGNEVLAVGVGDTVQLLKVISDPETIQALENPPVRADRLEDRVKKVFDWTADRTKKKQDGRSEKVAVPLKQVLRKQLDQIKKERRDRVEESLRKDEENE
ncbi:flagellar biosynthetic protein FliO [Sporolactobacillus sp. THM7-7]|nr:flagellar biosynthetic protein FliO [Sporolactobacillus sp. THM7-7]